MTRNDGKDKDSLEERVEKLEKEIAKINAAAAAMSACIKAFKLLGRVVVWIAGVAGAITTLYFMFKNPMP